MLNQRLEKPRPRQLDTDCMIVVFRYITGANAGEALFRFCPYMKGQKGMSLDALTACLKQAGYSLTLYKEAAGGTDKAALAQFWEPFQGQAVILYGQEQMRHAVLVCSGGLCSIRAVRLRKPKRANL